MRVHPKFNVLFLLTAFVGILVFSLYTRSQVKEPYTILIGNPMEIPSEFRSKLPPGYSWIRKEDEPAIFPGTPESERELFILAEETTDIEKIMDWARTYGKKEIYFFYLPPPDPDEIIVDLSMAYFTLPNLIDWKGNLLELISPDLAWADSVPSPNGCTSGIFKPAGSCYTFGCDFAPCDNCPNDGLLAKIKVCINYDHYTCYGILFADHIMDNIWTATNNHSTGGSSSLVQCMNGHNSGSPFMCDPVNTTIQSYITNSDPQFVNFCGGQVAACGTQPSKTTPRKSINQKIYIADNTTRNNWGVVRHEAAHNYGYCHAEMDFNVQSVAHCINGNNAGQCVSSNCGVACSNSNNCQFSSNQQGKCLNGNKCCIPGSFSGSSHIVN